MGRLCTLTAIVTMDNHHCISNHDDSRIMEIPEFEKKVRQQTLGCTIIMGRKTWERTKPLFNRTYIVLSKDKDYKPVQSPYYKVFVAHRLLEVLFILTKNDTKTAYVCGGKSIYNQLNNYISNFIVCRIKHNLHCKDKFINTLHNKKYLCTESKQYEYINNKAQAYNWVLNKYIKRTPEEKILPSVAHLFNKK